MTEDATARHPPGARRVRLALGLVLLGVSVALYAPSLGFELTMDDPLVTTLNRDVQRVPPDLRRLFSTTLYAGTPQAEGHADLYRPVPKTLLAVEYLLAGQRFDPRWLHATSLVLYGVCVVAVFGFVLRVAPGPGATARAFVATLLFAVFPAHLETVCSVKHREETLALGLGLAAWLMADRGPTGRRVGWVTAATGGALFLLALLSKESAILLFPCLLLLAGARRGLSLRRLRDVPASVWAFSAATLLYLAARGMALGSLLGPPGTRRFFGEEASAAARVLTSAETFFRYSLWDQLVALELDPAFSSPFVVPRLPSVDALGVAAGAVLAGALAVSLWALLRHGCALGFALVFLLVTSFLTFHVVPIGSAGAFRLMFTPSLGLCLALALMLERGLEGLGRAAALPARRRRLVFVGAGILVALGYAAATLARMPVFESDATLFAHSTAVEPRNPVSPFAAGQAFGARGDVEAKRRFFEVSLDRFLRYRDRPDLFDERSVDAFAAVSTEVALARLQQEPERAIALADLAIEQFGLLRDLRGGRTDSNVTGPYYVKALALRRLGRLDESRVACRAGLALAYHRGLDELLRSLTGR